MKLLKKDLRHGIVKLKIDDPEDAWKLQSILEVGDLISGTALRSSEVVRGDEKEKTKKKPIFVKISLEKKEFHEYTGRLRLTGKIVDGPEEFIGSYQSLEADVGKILTMEKEWKKWQLDKLERSLKKQPKVLVCVLDEREATIAEVGEKIKVLTEITNKNAGKEFGGSSNKEYFGEIISFLKNKDYDKIVIAGPGFAKDDLMKMMDLDKKIFVDSCSHAGLNGIQELIKRGILDRVSEDSRISEETRIVEKFFEDLSKDGLVTYGKDDVRKALEMGAVEELLISESMVRELEDLLELAEKMRTKILIVSEHHEAGEKLKNMGGIAAFLRYKIE
ncbi:MAG: mRNA surveillance protein pelota [Candidatus Aenigmarchaeota archaeon]|nr:mRNA surveillance protein pelota [Candidatus Aenigmarchaeota archaeon]